MTTAPKKAVPDASRIPSVKPVLRLLVGDTEPELMVDEDGVGGNDNDADATLQNCFARFSVASTWSGHVVAAQEAVAFANACCPQ